MSKEEAIHQAEQHIQAAYKVLRDAGFNPVIAYERVQAIAIEIWEHACGLATFALDVLL